MAPAKERSVPAQQPVPLLVLARLRRRARELTTFLASSDLQIFIWDMTTISANSRHYTPGSTASKPGDVTSVAWNPKAEYILASSLSSGYTIIWDLRAKKEIKTLSYGGGPVGSSRSSVSSVCWHPENVSAFVASSTSPAANLIDSP